jgi:hypothetical protein
MAKVNDEKVFGFHIVGLFDLLGQANALSQFQVPVGSFDKNELLRLLKQSHVPVQKFRKTFQDIFREIDGPTKLDISALTADQQQVFRDLKASNIRYFGFSDTFVAHAPLNEFESKVPVASVFGLFAAAAVSMLFALVRKSPARGAIEVGFGMEFDEGDLYGKVYLTRITLNQRLRNTLGWSLARTQ